MKRDLVKLLIALVELAVIVMGALWIIGLCRDVGLAESVGEMYVMCQPDSYLTVRERPKRTSTECGQIYLGDRVETDGKRKNGFLHIVNANTESGEGWVYARYLVTDRPVLVTETAQVTGKGRLALRRYPGGKRIKWLKPGDVVTVYAWSAEWCVTNRGFVDSDYLEGE